MEDSNQYGTNVSSIWRYGDCYFFNSSPKSNSSPKVVENRQGLKMYFIFGGVLAKFEDKFVAKKLSELIQIEM